jgi:hypothetical protein
MIIDKRIGIFGFKASGFQEKCLPYAVNVLSAIDSYLSRMAIFRNEKLQETMRVTRLIKLWNFLSIKRTNVYFYLAHLFILSKEALKMLDKDPTSVEEFIEHLATLSRINNELSSLDTEFHLVTRLFAIALDFNLEIDLEQLAFFKSLGSTFHHLKVNIVSIRI